MKHLRLFETFVNPWIYVVFVESISGPDYGLTQLVVFSASNDEEAKVAFVDTLGEGSGSDYLHNEDIYDQDFSEDFISEVLDDKYWTGAGWNLSGSILGKFPSTSATPSDPVSKALIIDNDGWDRREKKAERRKASKVLEDLIGREKSQEIMGESRKGDEDFFRGIEVIKKSIGTADEKYLSSLSREELKQELDTALEQRDFDRAKMISKYLS